MRTRFAPSPTGFLHIGGARTALYNWLLARHAGGELVLRIEDTDRERSTPEAVEQILEALRWLELDWDEGPVSQFGRAQRHREAIGELLAAGAAYEDQGAVRLRVPDEGETSFRDAVRGEVTFQNADIQDFVIARSDGSALYNLAVAVDDLDMGITHVVRGEDHISNTPRQLLVVRGLGAEPPCYAHLPLLHGQDHKPLSKRHGAASVQELRDAGYLPEAVRNYLALLGWGFDEEQEFFSTQELVEKFSLERVSKSPAVFDPEKLRWMNGRYLRELPVGQFAAAARAYLDQAVPEARAPVAARPDSLAAVAAISQEKVSTLDELWPLVRFFFLEPELDQKAYAKVMKDELAPRALEAARSALGGLEPFDVATVETALRGVVEDLGAKPRQVFQPLRLALSGTTVSPGIFESVAVIGRHEALRRVDALLERAARQAAP